MRSRQEERGLSVVESLVSLFLLGLLGIMFAAIFGQARTATDGGMERIAVRGEHRVAQRRLTTLLRAAVPPNEVQPALAWPAVGKTETTARFFAPANTLDASVAFDPRMPDYPEFTISLVAGGALQVRRSDGTGPQQRFGKGLTSVAFQRDNAQSLEATLVTQSTVRGAAGGRKAVTETSRNLVRIPSIR